MKLITKFILIYLFVSLIVLSIAGVLSYHIIKDEIDKELKWEFLDRIDRVTYLIEEGKTFDSNELNSDENLHVESLIKYREDNVRVTDTLIWDHRLEQEERNVKVSAYRNIGDTTYFISTYGNMIESDDITEAVAKILLWILAMQVIGALGIGYFVSGSLFKPFRSTLKRIQQFNLNDRQYLEAEPTNVTEFADLNTFVEEMTKKAVSDYKNLKEFAENASHELQTPLAIAKGKLELLAETELTAEQFEYLEKLERSLKKLSRLSESLALLTKIENHEFKNSQEIDLSEMIQESIESFREFTDLQHLSVETAIEDHVKINIHPVLADILWTNLYHNAIRHNIEKGTIRISLQKDLLKISNNGENLSFDPELLFERFKKADQNSNSIGLGLSIIKRICDQLGYQISYTNDNGWHSIEIRLKSVKTG
jgi:signal transduction histidine kinase